MSHALQLARQYLHTETRPTTNAHDTPLLSPTTSRGPCHTSSIATLRRIGMLTACANSLRSTLRLECIAPRTYTAWHRPGRGRGRPFCKRLNRKLVSEISALHQSMQGRQSWPCGWAWPVENEKHVMYPQKTLTRPMTASERHASERDLTIVQKLAKNISSQSESRAQVRQTE